MNMNMNSIDYSDASFDDICGLGDIFPDLEPYLEEVTNTFDEAKNHNIDINIDGSDSDSGISGDNFKSIGLTKLSNQNSLELSIPLEIDCVTKNNYDERKDNCEVINLNNISEIKQESINRKTITPIRIFRSSPLDNVNNTKIITNINQSQNNKMTNENSFDLNAPCVTSNKKICIRNVSSNCQISNIPKISFERNKTNDNVDSFELFNSSPNQNFHNSQLYNNSDDVAGIFDPQQVDRLIKKQERMIKNRQAASLSRQRKKEYMERLEHKVDQQRREYQFLQNQLSEIRDRYYNLEQENQILKKDIQCWRERYYELEKHKVKQSSMSIGKEDISKTKIIKTTAASTTLLGVILLLTLNFSGTQTFPFQRNMYSSIFNSYETGSQKNMGRIGRTLFSVALNRSDFNNRVLSEFNSTICNSTDILNSSETRRLTNALNSWGYRYKSEYNKVLLSENHEEIFLKSRKLKDKKIFKKKKDFLKNKRNVYNKQLEIYKGRNGAYKYFDDLINDIGRNPDTLYFVSMASDNWIYPATSTNKKNFTTPKITLLLPAYMKTKNKDHQEIMKIDCEVRNFTVLNIKKFSP